MREPRHPGEVVRGADSDQDAVTCELDEACPGKVLISIQEDGEFAGGIYLKAQDAQMLGEALIFFAEHSDYWVEVD